MRLQTIAIMVALTLAGFALRLHYLSSTHPFFDEYTTVLAARQILEYGWPILPSGLFYEHGLLATYVITPFTALFINTPIAQWQPAHWGLMLARWPSVLAGTVTIPLIFATGRRCLTGSTRCGAALLAAGLLALSPEGMVWGGRARMYALATLLVLLTVFLAYRGAFYPAPTKYRWWALLTLLAALLTQFGAMILVPPLMVGMIIVGWLSHRQAISQHRTGKTTRTQRPWFLRPTIILEGAVLAVSISLAIWIKRLGQPLGATALSSLEGYDLLAELAQTITYQTTIYFTWPETIKFLARQFGIAHHVWLTGLALTGALIGLAAWWLRRAKNKDRSRAKGSWSITNHFYLFLWIVFGLIIMEMVILLEPFRRNPRYIVMYLPLFYLIAGNAVFNFRFVPRLLSGTPLSRSASRATFTSSAVMALLTLFAIIGYNDLKVALLTPEPAYEEAFAWLGANRQPNDLLLTMNTPAAGLYLGRADAFTVQTEADQFLLDTDAGPVDRWLGVPWLGRAAEFNYVLNSSDQVWFVIDTIRQPVYFQGDWLAMVNSQMELVWTKDNALIYRTRPDRTPIATQPDVYINTTLADSVEFIGYALQALGQPANPVLNLTLFWQPLTALPADYTIFLHLRNSEGATVAQRDSQPLDGAYPTSRWQPDETVIDPIWLPLPQDLPAGQYQLYTGLYRLDTMERLSVAGDTSGENAVYLGEVTIP